MTPVKTNEKPRDTAPFLSRVIATEAYCAFLCMTDTTCYGMGTQQQETAWLCDLYRAADIVYYNPSQGYTYWEGRVFVKVLATTVN